MLGDLGAYAPTRSFIYVSIYMYICSHIEIYIHVNIFCWGGGGGIWASFPDSSRSGGQAAEAAEAFMQAWQPRQVLDMLLCLLREEGGLEPGPQGAAVGLLGVGCGVGRPHPRRVLPTLWAAAVSSILPNGGFFVEKLRSVDIKTDFPQKVVCILRDFEPERVDQLVFLILKIGLAHFCASELDAVSGMDSETSTSVILSLTVEELQDLASKLQDQLKPVMRRLLASSMERVLTQALAGQLSDVIPEKFGQRLQVKHVVTIAKTLRSQKLLEWTGSPGDMRQSLTKLFQEEPWSLLLKVLNCSLVDSGTSKHGELVSPSGLGTTFENRIPYKKEPPPPPPPPPPPKANERNPN